jgi:death-on-curing protein
VTKEPRWISKAAALAIHERLLAEHGGAAGILDEGLLDAALAALRNHFAYDQPDIFHLAAIYAHGLTRNHPFSDGNKRVALTVAGVFLELNGFRLDASEQEAVTATLALSDRTLDAEAFAAWLRGSCTEVQRTKASGGTKSGSRRIRPRSPKR